MKVCKIISNTGYKKPNNNLYLFQESNGTRMIINIEDSFCEYFESFFSDQEDMTIREAIIYLERFGINKTKTRNLTTGR